MGKPTLIRAFFSVGLWHIWDGFTDDSTKYYKTASTVGELMQKAYSEGYHLVTTDNHGNYWFELVTTPKDTKQ